MRKFLKQLFCKHVWNRKVPFEQVVREEMDFPSSGDFDIFRVLNEKKICLKCGEERWQETWKLL